MTNHEVIQSIQAKPIWLTNHKQTYNLVRQSQYIYEYVSLIGQLPKCERKWSEYLNTELNWEDIHIIPYCITRETYMQSFQYKIVHRFYPCNYALSIWYSDHTPCCNYCGEIDYLEHIFFNCKQVEPLWDAIQGWWKNILDVTFKLNAQIVLFGIPKIEKDPILDIINLCILLSLIHI